MTYPKLIIHGKTIFILAEEKMFFMRKAISTQERHLDKFVLSVWLEPVLRVMHRERSLMADGMDPLSTYFFSF